MFKSFSKNFRRITLVTGVGVSLGAALGLTIDVGISAAQAYLQKLFLTPSGADDTPASITLDGTNGDAQFRGSVTIEQDLNIYPGSLTDSSVLGEDIADGTITSADIANGTITSTDIANGTITSTDIANGTITSADIANGTITSADIANGTITSTDIADGTITSADIRDGEVKRDDLNSDVKSRIDDSYTCSINSAIGEVRFEYSPVHKDPQGDNSEVRRVFRLALANAHDKMWEAAAQYGCKEVRLALGTRLWYRSYRTSCIGGTWVTRSDSHTDTPYVVYQQDRCGNTTRPDSQRVRVYFRCCK